MCYIGKRNFVRQVTNIRADLLMHQWRIHSTPWKYISGEQAPQHTSTSYADNSLKNLRTIISLATFPLRIDWIRWKGDSRWIWDSLYVPVVDIICKRNMHNASHNGHHPIVSKLFTSINELSRLKRIILEGHRALRSKDSKSRKVQPRSLSAARTAGVNFRISSRIHLWFFYWQLRNIRQLRNTELLMPPFLYVIACACCTRPNMHTVCLNRADCGPRANKSLGGSVLSLALSHPALTLTEPWASGSHKSIGDRIGIGKFASGPGLCMSRLSYTSAASLISRCYRP